VLPEAKVGVEVDKSDRRRITSSMAIKDLSKVLVNNFLPRGKEINFFVEMSYQSSGL
jgi:hypothetical protein